MDTCGESGRLQKKPISESVRAVVMWTNDGIDIRGESGSFGSALDIGNACAVIVPKTESTNMIGDSGSMKDAARTGYVPDAARVAAGAAITNGVLGSWLPAEKFESALGVQRRDTADTFTIGVSGRVSHRNCVEENVVGVKERRVVRATGKWRPMTKIITSTSA